MSNSVITYFCKLFSQIINKVADILIPKEEKVKLLEKLGPNGLFENIPQAENFDFKTNKIMAIFNYKNTLCRQAIWEIKYRANKKLIRDFSLLLYEYIIEELSDLETFNNFKKPILLPIPSSKEREREKGFNQCILITRELIDIDKERGGNNFSSLENFLIKKIDTLHQTKVSNRKKRLENLRGSFSINKSVKLSIGNNSLCLTKANYFESFPNTQPRNDYKNFSFIIIDDVITTGATMNEAFLTLKSAGINPAKIRGFALAH
jgi:competence protein ComFC